MFHNKTEEMKIKFGRKSLYKTVRRLILVVVLFVLVFSFILNLVFFRFALESILSVTTMSMLNQFSSRAQEIPGVEDYIDKIMETYRSMPDEVRRAGESPEYRAYFAPLEDDPAREELMRILGEIQEDMVSQTIYVAVYDDETSAVVHMADIWSEEHPFLIGEWENVTAHELHTFLDVRDDSARLYQETGKDNIRTITIGKDLKDSAGNTYCHALIDIPLLVINALAGIFVGILMVCLVIITLLIILISRLYTRRRLLIPIQKIRDAVESYATDRLQGDSVSTHFDKIDIKTGDELQELTEVMAGMEADVSRYEADLMKATAERERISTELSLASGIQERMLPSVFPAFPDRKEFDIYASMSPAKEVGGDFYDFFLVDQNHLCMVIADVSGKGVPAALCMMSSKIILNNYASLGLAPREILREANNRICALDLKDMFVTAWLGILDLKTGEVVAGNAGHEYPVWKQAGASFELMRDKHRLVLGAMEDGVYDDYTFVLKPGSTLFLYTDGVPEATNAQEEQYGTERLVEALNRTDGTDPEMILHTVRADVDAFVKEAPQFDDLTMLCLYYKGPETVDDR